MADLLIFDIKQYALHDGPGIRTTVFLKGCPLCCPWCHNPESRSPKPYTYSYTERFHGKAVQTEKTIGKHIPPDELIRLLTKDQLLHEESGGGITFSGGEPLLQADSLQSIMDDLQQQGHHLCIDTSGFAPKRKIEKLMAVTDLFLFDLKLMQPDKHRYYTGVALEPIIENVNCIDRNGGSLRIRIPIIPDVNDKPNDIKAFTQFLSTLQHPHPVDLIPYHRLGSHKKERLALSEQVEVFEEPNREQMQDIEAQFKAEGINVRIGA